MTIPVISARFHMAMIWVLLAGACRCGASECPDLEEVCVQLRKQRTSLQTGVVHLSGRKYQSGPSMPQPLDGELRATIAFDHLLRRKSIQSRIPISAIANRMTVEPPRKPGDEARPRIEQIPGVKLVDQKLIATREMVVDYARLGEDSFSSVLISPPGTPFREKFLDCDIDVRAAGLMIPWSFETGMRVEPIIELIRKLEWTAVECEGGLVTLHCDNEAFDLKVTIDAEHGFTPLRYLQFDRRYVDLGMEGPSAEATATWKKVGAHWIPTQTRMRSAALNQDKALSEYELDIAFDWEVVNEPLAEELFDYRNWEIPDGVKLFDRRAPGKPVLVSVYGEPPLKSFGPPPDAGRIQLLIGFAGMLALIATLAVILLLWNRERSLRTPLAPPDER